MSRPKNSFEPNPAPQKKPIRAQKSRNNPNTMPKIIFRIEGNIENKSCYVIWADPKTILDSCQKKSNSPFRTPINDPQIRSKLKRNMEIKDVQLVDPNPNPKQCILAQKQPKNSVKIQW